MTLRSEEIFTSLRKGQQVAGRYMGVEYTGTVRSAREHSRTGNREVEIDFPAPLTFRGDWDVRTGLILTGINEGDRIEVRS